MASRRKLEVDEFKALVLLRKRKPHILVEGEDDISFYENLVESIGREYIVKHIGKYKNSSNCIAVIEFMQKLDLILNKDEHRQYFLGIIDGDARRYKNSMPQDNSLLYILQYYSWESYFVNKEVISKTTKRILKIRSLIDKNLVDYLYSNYIEKYLLNELWLCGLKQLRDNKIDKHCNQDNSINRLDNDDSFREELKKLESELFQFALENNIEHSLERLLEIIKGKWALNFFIKKYLQALKKLPFLCKNKKIKSCDFCKEEDFKNCLYRLKANYREEHIKVDITNLADLNSLTPIKKRILQLK